MPRDRRVVDTVVLKTTVAGKVPGFEFLALRHIDQELGARDSLSKSKSGL